MNPSPELGWAFVFTTDGQVLLAPAKSGGWSAPVAKANGDVMDAARAVYVQAALHTGSDVEPVSIFALPEVDGIKQYGFVFMAAGQADQPANGARWVRMDEVVGADRLLPHRKAFAMAAGMLSKPQIDFVRARDRINTLSKQELVMHDLWLHVLGMQDTAIHGVVQERLAKLNLTHSSKQYKPLFDPQPNGKLGDSSPLAKNELGDDFLSVPEWASLAKSEIEMSTPTGANLPSDASAFALGAPFRFTAPEVEYGSEDNHTLWSEWLAPLLEQEVKVVMQPRLAGVRMHLHYLGNGTGKLFTEEGTDRWAMFPRLAELCQKLNAENFAMDCVFVQWTSRSKPTPIPVWEMTWMNGGSEPQNAPVVINVLDLMWLNGERLTSLNLTERWRRLTELLPERVTLLEKVMPRPYTEARLTLAPLNPFEIKDQPGYAEGLTRALREKGSAGAVLSRTDLPFVGGKQKGMTELHSELKINVQAIGWKKVGDTQNNARNFVFRVALAHHGTLIPLETEDGPESADTGWTMCDQFQPRKGVSYRLLETNALALDQEPSCQLVLSVLPTRFIPFQKKGAYGFAQWGYTIVDPKVQQAPSETSQPDELVDVLRKVGYQAEEVVDRPEALLNSFLHKTDGAAAGTMMECPYCEALLSTPDAACWNTCGWCKNVFWSEPQEGHTFRQDQMEAEPLENAAQCRVLKPGKTALKKSFSFFELSALSATHEGVMVALAIPKDVAGKLSKLVEHIPHAEPIPVEQMHLTLAYLGTVKNVKFDKALLERLVMNFAETHGALVGKVQGLGRFHGDGKEGAIYATFDCPELVALQAELVRELEDAYIQVPDMHGFTPHITLCYAPLKQVSLAPAPNIPVRLTKLVCGWGSDNWSFHSLNRFALRKSAGDPYQNPPVEQGTYSFVLQHHYRGKSAHSDLRLQCGVDLIGWTVMDQEAGGVARAVMSVAEGKRLDAIPELWKWNPAADHTTPLRAEPKTPSNDQSWLTAQGIVPKAEPGENPPPGATKNFPGVLTILDKGRVEYGAQTPDFHEYWLHGTVMQERWIARKLDDGAGWLFWKPQDQRPYVLSKDAQAKNWLPPFGYSALPKTFRDKVLPAMQFWKMGGKAAGEARAQLAEHYADLSGPGMRTKEEGGLEKNDRVVQVFKSDNMQQIVWGVVLEPDEVDSQGHFITEQEISDALHYYMLNYQLMDEEHSRVVPRTEAAPVEAMQLPVDVEWPVGDTTIHIKKGSWVMATKIFSDRMWQDYLDGKLNAYSIRGWGRIRDGNN